MMIREIKEGPGELKRFVKILGVFCMVWPFAFFMAPIQTLKETVAIARGNYEGKYNTKYPPGDPRGWNTDDDLEHSSEDLF